MDEAKTLIHMAISVMLTAMIITACVGLIALGYMLWGSFSREDMAKSRLNDYATLSAYDNTVVRGQEVIQLIESNSDIFVVVYDGKYVAGVDKNINMMDIATTDPYIYCPDEVAGAYLVHNINVNNTDNVTLRNAFAKLKGSDTSKSLYSIWSNLSEDHKLYTSKEHQTLMNTFLHSKHLGRPTADDTDDDSFAAFKSGLIYAEDGTTDIVGVVFIRQDIGGDLGVD